MVSSAAPGCGWFMPCAAAIALARIEARMAIVILRIAVLIGLVIRA
jgi:hypothetical protein